MNTLGTAGTNTQHTNTLIEKFRYQHRAHAAMRRMSLRGLSSSSGALAATTRNDRAKADILGAMSRRDDHTCTLLTRRIRRGRGTGMNRIIYSAGWVLLVMIATMLIGVCGLLLDLGGFTVGRLPLSGALAVLVSYALVFPIAVVWGRETARNRRRFAAWKRHV